MEEFFCLSITKSTPNKKKKIRMHLHTHVVSQQNTCFRSEKRNAFLTAASVTTYMYARHGMILLSHAFSHTGLFFFVRCQTNNGNI